MEEERKKLKAKIKYFRILPPQTIYEKDEKIRSRKKYQPGTIIELRPGDIERRLISGNKGCDTFSAIIAKKMKFWDYRKPFDFSKWIGMQEPITFTEDGECELSYESQDKVLIGTWIKLKMLELFANRKYAWDNREAILCNCRTLYNLSERGSIRNIDTHTTEISRRFSMYSEEEIINIIINKCCFKGKEDSEIYPYIYQYEPNIFEKAKIVAGLISGVQELYEANRDERLFIPYKIGETWDFRKNRELLLGMINQSFYKMLVYNAREIRRSRKRCFI